MTGRIHWRHPFWNGKRKDFTIAIVAAALMLILLFLANMSYLYGSIFNANTRAKALKILAVDFDGGVIGQSIRAAYSELQSDDFPTLHFESTAKYPDVQSVRNAVCHGDYWGAIFSQPDASTRLSAALSGGNSAASYNASNTLTYVLNSVNYASVELGDVLGNLQTLIGAATPAYHALNSTAIASLNTSSRAAILAFTDPIRASSIDIMPTPQSTKVLYNTVTMVLPIIQQFFFLMALNGINNSFSIYGRLKSSRIGITRLLISLLYTLVASATVAGYIWAFRENWDVMGTQFVLTWMAFWLYMHINFNILDAVTAFIPPSFLSFFVLTWVILNVTSAIYPFELSPGFYRIGYALPAHEIYSVLVTIWSGGCNNHLYRALPILFAWEVVGMAAAVAGMFYRNGKAKKEIMELEGKENAETRDELVRLESHSAGPSFPMPFLGNEKRLLELRRQGTV